MLGKLDGVPQTIRCVGVELDADSGRGGVEQTTDGAAGAAEASGEPDHSLIRRVKRVGGNQLHAHTAAKRPTHHDHTNSSKQQTEDHHSGRDKQNRKGADFPVRLTSR